MRLIHPHSLIHTLRRILVPLALISTLYLYLYPVFHFCAFPSIPTPTHTKHGSDENNNENVVASTTGNARSTWDPRADPHNRPRPVGEVIGSWRDTLGQHLRSAHVDKHDREASKQERIAPFRLLVLADPQIEGDSSLPKKGEGLVSRVVQRIGTIWRGRRLDGEKKKEQQVSGTEEEVVLTTDEKHEATEEPATDISESATNDAGDSQTTAAATAETESTSEGTAAHEQFTSTTERSQLSSIEVLESSAGEITLNATQVATVASESPDMDARSTKTNESAKGLSWKEKVPVREKDRDPTRFELAIEAFQAILLQDLPRALEGMRKRFDLFGNDFYLAHIYRALNWWTKPSHVTVLGDLIGSQWVKDDEFERRGWRYWNRVMAGGELINESITTLEHEAQERIFKIDDPSWKRKVINIAGNHDIGYAGDISEARMRRFERIFGKANWDVRFEYPAGLNGARSPSLHLINLNSLMLDTPPLSEEIQSATYEYMNGLINHRLRPVEDSTSFTLVLTHLPLFKKTGICIDPPFFDFWGDDDGGGVYRPHGLKEQNHLSRHASEPGMLEALFGMKGDVTALGQGRGRHGLVLNGHDHEGCDTWHYIHVNRTWNSSGEEPSDRKTQWKVAKIADADSEASYTGVREITLRSMMGEFGGNAGLLSMWYDFDRDGWQYEFQTCKLGVQHIWWAVHIIDLLAVVVVVLAYFTGPLRVEKVSGISKSHLDSENSHQGKSNGSATR